MEAKNSKVMSIFMWPDGGMSQKVIDMGDDRDRRKFAKMASACNAQNGVVVTMGVNKGIPDNGWRALHKEMGKRGFIHNVVSETPVRTPENKGAWAQKLLFWK